MSKVVLDEPTFEKLSVPGDEVELCDLHGKTRGYFVAPEQYQRLLYSWAKSQFSDAESQKALVSVRANGGKSTKEVLALLDGIERGLNARG